jgi:Mrp family chromosome partitioning ATPase
MTPGGAEALKVAIRRSLPIIIVLVLLGIGAVNGFEQLRGARYQASANVDVPTTSFAQIVTGVSPPFVDPQQELATAQTIASAPQVYKLAAAATGYRYGRAGDLGGSTSVTNVNGTTLLQFSSTASTPDAAVAIANATANAYVAYQAQLTSGAISNTISRLQSTLSTLPTTGGQRAQLQAQITKLQVLRGASNTGANVAQPALSASKTSPNPKKDSLIGFGIGLVIALLLVALREAVDTTVRSENDVEEVLSAPVLASIRTLPRRTQIVTLGRFEPMFGDAYALLAAQLAPDKRESDRVVLALTSAVAGEGKTTTAANVAVSLALRGEDVVLADFDFHRPTLANLFEIPTGVSGALQVLEGTDTVEETLWEVGLDGPKPTARWRADPDAVEERRLARRSRGAAGDGKSNGRAKGAGSLFVLPSGKQGAAESRPRTAALGSLLRDLSAAAPIVILDTPPALLTVEMTELAQLIDMVIVVVRQGKVSQRVLRSLGRHARSWPAELSGAVLTDVPTTSTYGTYYTKT